MPILQIDPTLQEVENARQRYNRTAEVIFEQTIPPGSGPTYTWTSNGRIPTKPASEVTLGASFGNEDMALGHVNYAEYLCQAYAKHLGIVLTPDIIWHTVLCEIAAGVRAEPDRYASLFTTTPDAKQEITVQTGHVEHLPLDALISALKARVPTDASAFMPEFSTTDDLARFTRYAAFTDVCSPYYNYMTLACGFPAIDVRGTPDDYARIITCAETIAEAIRVDGDTDLSRYLIDKIVPTVLRIVAAVADEDAAFFSKILRTERCGSGGDIEVDGWWPTFMYVEDFRRTKPPQPADASRPRGVEEP